METKTCSQCQGKYYLCECGVALNGVGSTYAEHSFSCKALASGYGFDALGAGGLFQPNDGVHFPIWECPGESNLCPKCWHESNKELEKTEFSKLGAEARGKLFGL